MERRWLLFVLAFALLPAIGTVLVAVLVSAPLGILGLIVVAVGAVVFGRLGVRQLRESSDSPS